MKYLLILLVFVTINAKAQRMKSDTLVITDTAIHFITIGNQTFEIQRTVTIAIAPPPNQNLIDNIYQGTLMFPKQGGITLLNNAIPLTTQ